MTPAQEQAWKEWIATRPECVQKLAAEFPPGTKIIFEGDGTIAFIIGYNEDDSLIITKVDPSRDYQKALEARRYICAEHLRKDARVFFPQ